MACCLCSECDVKMAMIKVGGKVVDMGKIKKCNCGKIEDIHSYDFKEWFCEKCEVRR